MKLPRWQLPPDWPWLALSVVLHTALLVFLLLNREPTLTPAATDEPAEVIQAHVLDATRLEEEREAARAAQQAREEAARQRAQEAARREAEEQARREAQAQERREAEARRQREAEEQQRREAEARREREAEAQRQREAEAQARREAEERERREAEEQARREAEERERREAEEQARQEAEERERREAEAQARREAELAERLEAEAQARRTTELDRARSRYVAAIRDRIRGNWRLPSGESEEFECRVQVTQAPGGQVLNVRILQSCGSSALDRSVESAVLRSSPLPSPPDPDVFARDIEFVFRPR